MFDYTYNSDGIRTQKKVYSSGGVLESTVNYILDGSKIIAEYSGNNYTYYVYDESGTVMGMMYNNQLYTFRKNLQGDVTGIYNANGELVAEYRYSPYGEILAITNGNGVNVSTNTSHIANINPFRYRDYYYDTETGFYYLQTRYYDPVVGRFLNADTFVSTGQSILGNNMFAYVLNNPVNRYDPYGSCSACVEGKCGPCSDGFYRDQAKQNNNSGSTDVIKPAPICPKAVIHEIEQHNIPDRFAVNVSKNADVSFTYCGSYTSGGYTVFTFSDEELRVSDYYFKTKAKKQKCAELEQYEIAVCNAIYWCDTLSMMGEVYGAPEPVVVASAVLSASAFIFEEYYDYLSSELYFYRNAEETVYEFCYVKTCNLFDYVKGGNSYAIVYP